MNLIQDPWIPIRRSSGEEARIAPWQITERLEDDPVVALASPRADFDGSLVQLWIGLLQGALTPETERDWRKRFDEPPAPDELRAAFEPWAPYFELWGNGPRFLQDLELEPEESVEADVEKLLIDCGLSAGKDHFVKGGRVERMCRPCVASALLTLMTNAPSGGRGHRTSLRGGGPLTTLVRHEKDLWATLWLNVLLRESFESGSGNAKKAEPEDRFPWLAPTRTSETKGGVDTTGEDVHPLQMFFGMPRRIRLVERQPTDEPVRCDLCAEPADDGVEHYFTRHSGINYTGSWEHPLSPHREGKDGTILPLHGSSSDLPYTEWLGLVQNDPEQQRRPARVVLAAYEKHRSRRLEGLRLWAFGYDMDNMKARAWCEGTMPLYLAEPEHREDYGNEGARLVLSAKLASHYLSQALKQAWKRRPKDLSHPPWEAGARFLQLTEGSFYESLVTVLDHLRADEELLPLREAWRRRLVAAAEQVFDTYSQTGLFQGADPRQVAEAHNALRRNLYGKKLRELLSLPKKSNAA